MRTMTSSRHSSDGWSRALVRTESTHYVNRSGPGSALTRKAARRSLRTGARNVRPFFSNGPTPSQCSLLFAQAVALIRYDGLDQLRKLRERFLPSEIAHFERNWFRNAFLNDVQLSAARNATES